ncbi:MAG: hypothetical protein ACTSVV_04930 [Promethearchaeota archaeon]
MRYECPFCGSLKKPKIVSYFPPVICQCLDCSRKAHERDFIKKDEKVKFTPLPQFP